MNIFEWMNGGPQLSEVDRAIRLIQKQSHYSNLGIEGKTLDSNVLLIGNWKTIHTFSFAHMLGGRSRKKYFKYFTVKFSQDGNSAMISSNGSPDFFFSTQEETNKLKNAIKQHFQES